jgi:hypothetical protein
MISSEVQRTLVKSPPELWAELSDPTALARHLGELGEVKITKVEPEQTVEWEAEAAKGKVELKPSGWGTKVTLSVTQELPDGCDGGAKAAPEAADCEADAVPPDAEAKALENAQAPEAQATSVAETADCDPVVPDEAAPDGVPEEPQMPRPGFFARLFRRKAKAAKALTPAPEDAGASQSDADGAPAQPQATTVAAEAVEDQVPAATDEIEQADEQVGQPVEPVDLAAELLAAEEALAAQTTEMLRTVLDRLGAAHHRPFSRA